MIECWIMNLPCLSLCPLMASIQWYVPVWLFYHEDFGYLFIVLVYVLLWHLHDIMSLFVFSTARVLNDNELIISTSSNSFLCRAFCHESLSVSVSEFLCWFFPLFHAAFLFSRFLFTNIADGIVDEYNGMDWVFWSSMDLFRIHRLRLEVDAF